ncbi:hypothetical protein BH23CHL8_BH23CHL8_19020 [soil metagenome]
MDTFSDAVGEFTTVSVRAQDHDSAVRRARAEARRAGYRVEDVAAATRQPESHRWVVEMRVESR